SVGGASTSVSQQTQQIPLISVDQIERFPQGKAIILNPGYGDRNDVKRPIMGQIGIPQQDIDRAIQAETTTWTKKIRPALARRKAKLVQSQEANCVDLSQLNQSKEQDWTTKQLNLRLAHAAELLPLPPSDD
ncbi:MAG: type IV secretory system conjugative DNA transfer family protein, partial [Cyanobacteria bacterium J06558_2]